jgi:hypothetical protein
LEAKKNMNNGSFSLHPIIATLPAWIMTLVLLALGLLFIGGEIRRHRSWLAVRIVAQIIVLVGIIGLLLRPSYFRQLPNAGIMVLTKGYPARVADSLTRKDPSLKVERTADAGDYPASSLLGNISLLRNPENHLRFVLGEGLPESVLDAIPGLSYGYFPDSPAEGITDLVLEPFDVNRRTAIHGRYQSRKPTTLLLTGPGGREDSVNIPAGDQPFVLRITPKLPGRFIYTIQKKTDPRSSAETLPVDVREPRKLKILFVVPYPGAEIKYLKNYLADNGHEVLLRYQVSKNIFRYESVNGPTHKMDRLTPDALRKFDLLMASEKGLREMAGAETKILSNAVDDGLGVVILSEGDSGGGPAGLSSSLALTGRKPDTAIYHLKTGTTITLPIIMTQPSKKEEVIILAVHGKKIISGFQNKGLGKIGFELLQETYSLVLHGQPDVYAEVWSPVLEEVARRRQYPFSIRLTTPFPRYVNEPVSVEIISSGAKPTLLADGNSVALIEDVRVDDVWYAKVWAGQAGWHELMIAQDSTRRAYYISPPGEWRALAHAHRVEANQARNTRPVTTTGTTRSSTEVSRWLFFFMFLIGSGFLWLAPKL